MSPRYSPGQIVLASVVFSNQLGTKNRPVLVVHDGGDDDLLVAPITSRVGRSQHDIFLNGWQQSGLRLPSVARIEISPQSRKQLSSGHSASFRRTIARK